MSALPELYFRTRDNGALVFRVATDNRQRRIDLDQIAVVNLNKGDIRPHGDTTLSPAEEKAIRDWMRDRQAIAEMRAIDDIHRTIDQLHKTAQWAQSRANDAQLDDVTEPLLLAMHDLRTVLVRKKSDRL